MSVVLFVEDDSSGVTGSVYKLIRANTDVGTVRMKSLHLDMVFSPSSAASQPGVMEVALHRVHENVADVDLVTAQGSRVKVERVTFGRNTDRYYRMWLKAINIEYGQQLKLVVTTVSSPGGSPTYGLGARWWELQPDVAP